jgi:hypothetical protein
MRSLALVGSLLLAACGASEVQSQRLKDGSWSFTCELGMDECVRRVQEHCPNQRYRILEGTSETRLRDAPPFERAYHTSRLHLVCNDDGANVLLSIDSSKGAPAAATSAPACTVGQTRECIGGGACKGGQTCLADRSGFGSCDCGPAALPPAPVAPSEAVTAPANPSDPAVAPATPPATTPAGR